MRPEDTLHLQQLRKLANILKENIGATTTKVGLYFLFYMLNDYLNVFSLKDAMFGGIATWDRENNSFQIHKSGITSEGNLRHIEVECLASIEELMKKKTLQYDNLFYMYLNKAPCADYNGNRKNCLDKMVKWAKNMKIDHIMVKECVLESADAILAWGYPCLLCKVDEFFKVFKKNFNQN